MSEERLPEGWVWTYLDNISAKITDGEHIRPIITSMGTPFLSAKDVRTEGIIFNDSFCVSEDDAKKFRIRCNPELGDILIVSRGATVGRSCMVNTERKFCLLGSVILIKLYSTISNDFISYAIKSAEIQNQLIGLCGSTAQQAIYIRDIRKIYFPLPPLPEQRAIVAKIEQLFSDLDNGIANLKKAQEQLKIYRQAVLKKAFVGELTRKWREEQTDLPSAEELLQQIKEEREKHYQKQLDVWEKAVKEWEDNGKEWKKPSRPKKLKELPPLSEEALKELPELPGGWCWVKFGNVCLKIFDGTHFSPKNYDEGVYKYITAKNIKEGRFDLSKITYVIEEDHKKIYARCDVKKGDVLYIKDGATTGKATVNYLDEEFSLLSSVGVFRTNQQLIVSKFIEHYLNSESTRNRMLKNIAGVAITRLTLVKLNNSILALASTKEQHQIVKEIETRLSVCDKLEATIAESLQKSEALRQSILKRAFEGKLLNEKQLEEARNAPDWEPAEKLLERIKREKEKPGTKKSF